MPLSASSTNNNNAKIWKKDLQTFSKYGEGRGEISFILPPNSTKFQRRLGRRSRQNHANTNSENRNEASTSQKQTTNPRNFRFVVFACH